MGQAATALPAPAAPVVPVDAASGPADRVVLVDPADRVAASEAGAAVADSDPAVDSVGAVDSAAARVGAADAAVAARGPARRASEIGVRSAATIVSAAA